MVGNNGSYIAGKFLSTDYEIFGPSTRSQGGSQFATVTHVHVMPFPFFLVRKWADLLSETRTVAVVSQPLDRELPSLRAIYCDRLTFSTITKDSRLIQRGMI